MPYVSYVETLLYFSVKYELKLDETSNFTVGASKHELELGASLDSNNKLHAHPNKRIRIGVISFPSWLWYSFLIQF
jgi:hypothetical protein